MQALRWDVFCRVIDNHGDLGVCWRLARELATRGQTVRLWVDDPTALGWMAPSGADRVEVQHWTRATPHRAPGDVVIEAFGCDPPASFVSAMATMAAARPAPLWINLEYLSAEAYVERCHGLPSPQQAGPGRGLLKWFFYPGFRPGTGGLLREADLASRRLAFDATGWLGTLGIEPRAGERRVSVFCYDDAARPELLQGLAAAPTLLLLTPGSPRQTLQALVCAQGRRSHVRCVELPWLSQPDYDHLLWACDLNIVRGEDSLVRALWAGAPFLWQIYPQRDGAHVPKLDAFLDLYLGDVDVPVGLRQLWRSLNGLAPTPSDWPDALSWQRHAAQQRQRLGSHADLVTQLLRFVDEKR